MSFIDQSEYTQIKKIISKEFSHRHQACPPIPNLEELIKKLIWRTEIYLSPIEHKEPRMKIKLFKNTILQLTFNGKIILYRR